MVARRAPRVMRLAASPPFASVRRYGVDHPRSADGPKAAALRTDAMGQSTRRAFAVRPARRRRDESACQRTGVEKKARHAAFAAPAPPTRKFASGRAAPKPAACAPRRLVHGFGRALDSRRRAQPSSRTVHARRRPTRRLHVDRRVSRTKSERSLDPRRRAWRSIRACMLARRRHATAALHRGVSCTDSEDRSMSVAAQPGSRAVHARASSERDDATRRSLNLAEAAPGLSTLRRHRGILLGDRHAADRRRTGHRPALVRPTRGIGGLLERGLHHHQRPGRDPARPVDAILTPRVSAPSGTHPPTPDTRAPRVAGHPRSRASAPPPPPIPRAIGTYPPLAKRLCCPSLVEPQSTSMRVPASGRRASRRTGDSRR